MEKHEYILGTHAREIERLRVQHTAWVEHTYRLLRRAGICAGQSVADLGCGPGFTTLELARCVGPKGRVVACDRSERFLEHVKEQCRQQEIRGVETVLGDAERLDLPPDTLDMAYARWLLCWVPDASVIIERLARIVRPGGVLVFQEYLDWGAMKLVPVSIPFGAAVDACMQSWLAGKATINIAAQFPDLAARYGLVLEHFEPIARLGRVGSLEWRWVTDFLRSYLPGLVEQGLLTSDELTAFEADYHARREDGKTFIYTPTMANAILRRPG
jgi:ubiquinone/menaquinone biosynthesis C-methylase UbiE